MMEFKIITPLSEVPNGATVTKRTGAKPYVVRDRIRVFKEDRTSMDIPADENTRFLIDTTGNINAVSADKEVVWVASFEEVQALIHKVEYGDDDV